MPAVISPQVDDRSDPDSGRTQIMSSGLAPLRGNVEVEEAIIGGDRLGCHMILVALRSEKLPSTASATGRFGRGVDIACAVVLLASSTDLGQMRTASLAEKGFQPSVSIIVSSALRMTMMRRRRMEAPSWCSLIVRRRLCMPLLLRKRHASLGLLNTSLNVLNELGYPAAKVALKSDAAPELRELQRLVAAKRSCAIVPMEVPAR